MGNKPEDKAREEIDKMLEKSGWHVCDYKDANIHAHRGVVLRYFPLKPGHGEADYLFYVDGKAAGVIEAKRVLFLVDRANLGRQTLKEFQQFQSPYTPYKFTEEYIVQQLKSNQLDKDVVSIDQIRTVIKTFRDKLFAEIFPSRTEVPKTLIYAKDDSHAEDIVKIIREEFGKGNEFAQKITYKTTGMSTDDLIASFRNSYNPRIAVTVDMIATGTDIKPLEIVLFLRTINSRTYFEQMKGRGVRVINDNDLQSVTPDAKSKTHSS